MNARCRIVLCPGGAGSSSTSFFGRVLNLAPNSALHGKPILARGHRGLICPRQRASSTMLIAEGCPAAELRELNVTPSANVARARDRPWTRPEPSP